MKFDTSMKGLHTLFKPYQAKLLEWIWELNGNDTVGVKSNRAHKYLHNTPEKKSRASVIIFLDNMVEEGVLTYELKTGKGGYHRVYYPKMNRKQFSQYVVDTITNKLREVFPDG
ncbi:MAG: hypothetical protein JSV18_06045 [Candidatus Bathyarchaeota archaeon]|nr:MAG: hypothetical protein JSV18_06045 [Candidatus Bathyarchaeota archaeon]